MKKNILMATVVLSGVILSGAVFGAEKSAEAIFKEKCASCHPDGGNVMNPKKNLKGMKIFSKIISQIRNGGGGMPAFDAKAISDDDAKLLAGYIIKTFKK